MRTDEGQPVYLKDYAPPAYRVTQIDLKFRLDPTETLVTATSVVTRAPETPEGTPLVLDGDELELVEFSVNGAKLEEADYRLSTEKLAIDLPDGAGQFEVEIVTRVNPQANTKLMGLYRSSGNYCTQCEAEGFRRITFFPDRPDVLAIYTTRIEARVAEAPLLLGNGNPVDAGKLEDGWHYAVWHDPYPKPSYLFALVAGDLDSIRQNYVTGSGREVELAIYVERSKVERAEYAMDALVRSMRWDEERFGREYDLDVFNIVAVSDFNMGAMENKGLNIFNDKYVLADPDTATDADYAAIERIIAHEYFHNWTGNRITCRDWFQLCLKEGLTVYRDQEFTADERSRAVKRIADIRTLRNAQFPEDAGPLSHPVRPSSYSEINNFYTATVYEKGAEVVRMIATLLGDARFRAGMDLYFKRHDGDAATIEDFLACFEEAGQTDLGQFALWYSQAGTPLITASADYDKAKAQFVLEIEQSLAPTPGQNTKRPMLIPLALGLVDGNGNEIEPAGISGAETTDDGVVILTKRKHRIAFDGIAERPAISLNRGFSAPVNIDLEQSRSDLALLARHDSDPFNRWEAAQDYAMGMLVPAARSLAKGKLPKWDEGYIATTCENAAENTLNAEYRAQLLSPPAEAEIAQAMGNDVDPEAIHNARRGLMARIGAATEQHRERITAALALGGSYSPDAASAGARSLNNMLLTFGVMADSEAAEAASLRQFDDADNMTDRFAALTRIVHLHGSPEASKKALSAFEERYRGDALVMDKWFAVQASAPAPEAAMAVRQLMRHDAFSMTNPNRVRSVIGQFAMANLSGFHAEDGEGYRLVAEAAGTLDEINPQIAARLLTAFRAWRSMTANRQKHAREALEELASRSGISRDSSDILSRMLA